MMLTAGKWSGTTLGACPFREVAANGFADLIVKFGQRIGFRGTR